MTSTNNDYDYEHEHDGGRPDFVGAPRCERLQLKFQLRTEQAAARRPAGRVAAAAGGALGVEPTCRERDRRHWALQWRFVASAGRPAQGDGAGMAVGHVEQLEAEALVVGDVGGVVGDDVAGQGLGVRTGEHGSE